MFPIPSLSSAEKVLHETSGVNVEVITVALFLVFTEVLCYGLV